MLAARSLTGFECASMPGPCTAPKLGFTRAPWKKAVAPLRSITPICRQP